MAEFTPGPTFFACEKCGWSGQVNGRPRCLPCAARRTFEWRKSHPEKAKELKHRMDKKMRTERPWKEAKHKREVRSRNPEHYRMKYQERIQWLKSGDVVRQDLLDIYERDNGKCVYCGKPVLARFSPNDPRGFDHVIPRSKGGKHTKSNLVVSCADCNAAKSDKEVCINE